MQSCHDTGVNEIINSLSITVFPNPAHDKLSIRCAQKSETEILNTVGQSLKTLTAIEIHTTVDLSNFIVGIYIIKIKIEEEITVKKFIQN